MQNDQQLNYLQEKGTDSYLTHIQGRKQLRKHLILSRKDDKPNYNRKRYDIQHEFIKQNALGC